MCARFTLTSPLELLQRLYGFGDSPEVEARFNIAPSQAALAVFQDEEGGRHASMMRWGLTAPTMPTPVINVRSETADNHPLFRDSATHRRALVLTDGFYEWREEGSIRQPYYFQLPDRQPFGMAALFDVDAQGGRHFAVLTVDSTEDVRPIHDRMSLIVPPDDVEGWLKANEPITRSIPKGRRVRLDKRRVDPAVNDARREGPELLAPPRQQSLF